MFKVGDIVVFVDCEGDDDDLLGCSEPLHYGRKYGGHSPDKVTMVNTNGRTLVTEGSQGYWMNHKQFRLADAEDDNDYAPVVDKQQQLRRKKLATLAEMYAAPIWTTTTPQW